MNLLIHNLDIYFLMVKLEKMHESTSHVIERNLIETSSSRNLVVALKELSIRGDFHSTGKREFPSKSSQRENSLF